MRCGLSIDFLIFIGFALDIVFLVVGLRVLRRDYRTIFLLIYKGSMLEVNSIEIQAACAPVA
jgi:hypothetical protein